MGLKAASENSDNLGLVQVRNKVPHKVGVPGGIFKRQLQQLFLFRVLFLLCDFDSPTIERWVCVSP